MFYSYESSFRYSDASNIINTAFCTSVQTNKWSTCRVAYIKMPIRLLPISERQKGVANASHGTGGIKYGALTLPAAEMAFLIPRLPYCSRQQALISPVQFYRLFPWNASTSSTILLRSSAMDATMRRTWEAFFETTDRRRFHIGRSALAFDGQNNLCGLDDEHINFIFALAPEDKFMVSMEVVSRPHKFIDKPCSKRKPFPADGEDR